MLSYLSFPEAVRGFQACWSGVLSEIRDTKHNFNRSSYSTVSDFRFAGARVVVCARLLSKLLGASKSGRGPPPGALFPQTVASSLCARADDWIWFPRSAPGPEEDMPANGKRAMQSRPGSSYWQQAQSRAKHATFEVAQFQRTSDFKSTVNGICKTAIIA